MQASHSQSNYGGANANISAYDDDSFNFNTIANSSPYFWYPPVQNIRVHYEKMMNKRQ